MQVNPRQPLVNAAYAQRVSSPSVKAVCQAQQI